MPTCAPHVWGLTVSALKSWRGWTFEGSQPWPHLPHTQTARFLGFPPGEERMTSLPPAARADLHSAHPRVWEALQAPAPLPTRREGPGSRFSRSDGARPVSRWRSCRQLPGTACPSPQGLAQSRLAPAGAPAVLTTTLCVCRAPQGPADGQDGVESACWLPPGRDRASFP